MSILNRRVQVFDNEGMEKLHQVARDISTQLQLVIPLIEQQKRFKKSYFEPIMAVQKDVGNLSPFISFPKTVLGNYRPKSEMIMRPIKPKSEYQLEFQNQLLNKLIKKQGAKVDQKPFEYYRETKTFVTRQTVVGAINFSTRNGANNMSILFEIFYEFLEERGEIKNGYKTVFITSNEIIQRAIKKGIKEANMYWLKHTRSNIISSKIPQELKETVVISEYNNQKKGYEFRIQIVNA